MNDKLIESLFSFHVNGNVVIMPSFYLLEEAQPWPDERCNISYKQVTIFYDSHILLFGIKENKNYNKNAETKKLY